MIDRIEWLENQSLVGVLENRDDAFESGREIGDARRLIDSVDLLMSDDGEHRCIELMSEIDGKLHRRRKRVVVVSIGEAGAEPAGELHDVEIQLIAEGGNGIHVAAFFDRIPEFDGAESVFGGQPEALHEWLIEPPRFHVAGQSGQLLMHFVMTGGHGIAINQLTLEGDPVNQNYFAQWRGGGRVVESYKSRLG